MEGVVAGHIRVVVLQVKVAILDQALHGEQIVGDVPRDGACIEALDRLEKQNLSLNYCRIKAFPFSEEVREFIEQHDIVYVVEQNRDGQLRTLLINDIEADQKKLVSLLHYNGMPINSGFVVSKVLEELAKGRAA